MGGFFSRGKKGADFSADQQAGAVLTIGRLDGIHEEFTSDLQHWEDQQKLVNDAALQHLKDDFINRPDYFISNLLFLSTQFYKNFEQERNEISKSVRDKEIEYNEYLEPYRRRIHFVGAHEVIAASHILYKPRGVDHLELSSYRQIYVLQDNVQLYPEEEYENLQEATYSEVDGPSYRLCIEPSRRHVGYVRLRCVDIIPGVSRHNTYEDIYKSLKPVEDDEADPILDKRPIVRRPSLDIDPESPPMGGRLTERRPSGVLPVGYIKDLSSDIKKVQENINKTKKKNGISQPPENVFNKMRDYAKPKNNKMMRMDINDQAFKTLQEKLAGIDEDEEDDKSVKAEEENAKEKEKQDEETPEDEDDYNKIELHSTIRKECFINRKMKIKSESDVYGLNRLENNDKRTYLSSERYRQTFEDDFPEILKVLQKEDLIDNTEVEEPSIVTKDLYNDTLMINTEYIAGFSYSEWPDCAIEWRLRDRKTRADPITKLTYRWPKSRHIEEIFHQHGCSIIPMGYYNPRNPTRVMLIEWQLQFIRAEQILLRSLGHQQIRVLLMIQMLFRDHIDKDGNRVLRPQHLRYILFWLCEHNYRDWQDDRLAVKIKAYLKTLYNALAQGELPHYFIRRVNLLENIKERNLRLVQAAVKRINENLPMFLMQTISRLRMAPDFFPKLKIKEVYKLVSAKKYGIEELNPALAGAIPDEEGEGQDLHSDEDERENEEDVMLKRRLHAERERRKSLFLEKSGKASEKKVKKKKGIDLTVKVGKLNDLRAEKLMTIFIEHFVTIAHYSNQFEDHQQAYRFLNYAGNLLDLLSDEKMNCPQMNDTDVEELRHLIKKERAATRQGLNKMLNSTHRITEKFELKIAHPPPRPNWELKKPEMATQSSKKTEPKAASPRVQKENPVKGVKKFPKRQQENSVSKSLSTMNDAPMLRSMLKTSEDDDRILKFEVASDDDNEGESTDL